MKRLTAIGILTMLVLLNGSHARGQELGAKVYWMMTAEVSIGKLTEYHSFSEKELAPLLEKHGYQPVAVWQTIVGDIEEVIFVAAFDNMAAYHAARRSLLASEEWKSASVKFDGLVKNIRSRFLSAAPYSKLK